MSERRVRWIDGWVWMPTIRSICRLSEHCAHVRACTHMYAHVLTCPHMSSHVRTCTHMYAYVRVQADALVGNRFNPQCDYPPFNPDAPGVPYEVGYSFLVDEVFGVFPSLVFSFAALCIFFFFFFFTFLLHVSSSPYIHFFFFFFFAFLLHVSSSPHIHFFSSSSRLLLLHDVSHCLFFFLSTFLAGVLTNGKRCSSKSRTTTGGSIPSVL